MNNGPNFFIVGAQKCGTTSLYHFLGQHPDIFMSSIKEPEFFTFPADLPVSRQMDRLKKERVVDFRAYLSLFEASGKAKAVGEASPTYLYAPGAAERIKEHYPEARIIILLRNPVDRAFSHYHHNRNRGIEPLDDFMDALMQENGRVREGWPVYWHYQNNGMYSKHVGTYLGLFSAERVKIKLFEHFFDDIDAHLIDICRFLNVDDHFDFDTNQRFAVSGTPKYKALNWLILEKNALRPILKKIIPVHLGRQWKQAYARRFLIKDRLNEGLRKSVYDLFKSDIDVLESMLDCDLSLWRC